MSQKQVQVISPQRLEEDSIRKWTLHNQRVYAPIYAWRMQPEVNRLLSRALNSALTKSADDAIRRQVQDRGDLASGHLNVAKLAQIVYSKILNKMPPDKHVWTYEGGQYPLTAEFVQVALEMVLGEAGYEVEHGLVKFEFAFPDLDEPDEPEEESAVGEEAEGEHEETSIAQIENTEGDAEETSTEDIDSKNDEEVIDAEAADEEASAEEDDAEEDDVEEDGAEENDAEEDDSEEDDLKASEAELKAEAARS